ncbi:MAG TPA: TetR/AcrR family transcriptional regulator [Ktedonobacteraceae bacterium]
MLSGHVLFPFAYVLPVNNVSWLNAIFLCIKYTIVFALMQDSLALISLLSYTERMNTEPFGSTTSATPDPRRRTGGRSARIQATVFEATIQLLQEKGYEALSFATIGERTGVHETTLYRRWKTKEQLVIEAVASQVAQDIPVPDTGALRSDLIQLLQLLRTFLLSAIGQAIILMGIASKHTPLIESFQKDYWRRRSILLSPLFERAIARGELAQQTDIPLLFEMLIGVLYVRLFMLGETLDETLPERIVDLVLAGVDVSKKG